MNVVLDVTMGLILVLILAVVHEDWRERRDDWRRHR